MATLKLPTTKEIIGVLLSADVVETKNTEIVLLNIQDVDDKIVTISTSPKCWNKVGKLFPEDTIVQVKYEARVKDVTGYAADSTKPDVLTAHTSDGSNLSSITRFSSTAFQRMVDKKDQVEGTSIISSVELERANAVATYLAAFVRK